ncbi:neuraminidase-like domain-containing protein [Cedecea sp. NFIX57]|uniref:Tc toxin subunit A-related protein n=1 Tax=Cedecea sp. NFIX57 TaxID=1566286 RepID=UPI000A0ED03C|nr:neuraminidase-like domain-containing protein [Cedecea sp. NFIX57]SMG61705.1 hypothetical protein SAMN03159353_10544 [Cedecea sp. NFIX57]
MNTLSMLTKARTDALTAYLSIQPDKPALSPDEMYDDLLLDPQNSPDVMTSPVAEAINSLQLYISRCLNGQETKVNETYLTEQSLPGGFFTDWGQYNSHYDRWAGREKLRYFAADYIDPALRMNKTQLFQSFEQQINHGKLTESSVLNALQTYLINYERLTRLVTVNHLTVEVQTQTHVFFLARTTEDPCQFYWRKCVYETTTKNAVPAWSDWLPVTAHLPGDKELDIWLVWNRQRLHICWAESKKERQADGKTDLTSQYVSAISLNDDASWASQVSQKLLAQNDNNSAPTHYLVQSSPDNTEWLSRGLPLISGQETFRSTITSLVLPGGVAKGALTLTISDRKVNITCDSHFSTDDQTGYAIRVIAYDADTGAHSGEVNVSSQGNYTIDVGTTAKAAHLRLEVFSLRQDSGTPVPDKLLIVFDDFEYTKPDNITRINIGEKQYSLSISDGLPLLEALRSGPDALFSYALQRSIKDGENILNGFDSSYAAWVWEIFFHIPFLVSSRFCAEQRFTEAEKWAGYLFRPGGFRNSKGALLTDGSESPKPIYWNVIPLHTATPAIKPTQNSDDPDIIALNNPVQYKLAVWRHYLDVLIAQGDQAYREEERESLARARMYYIQAQQLLGVIPDVRPDVLWQDSLLPDVTDKVDELNSTPFLPPLCETLLTCRDRIELRLYNLRHNLSLTGQPLSLPLFAPPTDPEILLAQQQDNSAGDDTGTSKQINGLLPPERFPVLLERARNAVTGLIQLGNTFQSVLRQQDEQTAGLLLLSQQKAVQQETVQIQRNQLTALNAGLESLNKQIAGVEQRRDFLLQQLTTGVSAAELSALSLRRDAANVNVSSVTAMSLAGALDLAPNIFGMADGGSQWGAASSAASMAMQTMAGVKEQLAGIQETTSGYTRRQADWQQQLNSVRAELSQLRSQLTGAEISVVTAQKQLALTLRQQGYAQTVLDMQTTRFTGPTLYNWMSSRLASLYWPYYDMVHARCLNAMRALQYETGVVPASTTLAGTWSDLRQGLLAGEGLMLTLQKLEHDWLTQRKKALEVQKTISLEAYFSNKLVSTIKSTLANNSGESESITREKGILSIKVNIKNLDLQADYPDALRLGTRRQIKQISVTLPALLGPYQDVQAVLRYDGNSPHAPGCEAIAISHGMQDSGQFLLDFSNTEFLPFEGIPVDDAGNLILQFPATRDEQKALLNSLSDIIFHIRYTIRS